MKRILVIDDDPLQREWFKIALEEAEYKIIEAADGREGLRLFHQDPCEVVITDIFMPEKDGIETILELKREYPLVKILAISAGGFRGWSDDSDQEGSIVLKAAKDLGADRILHKPIKIETLLATVTDMFDS